MVSPAFFFPYGKIRFARPRSSVDRASASGAEERSSSLRGGASQIRPGWRIFLFFAYPFCIISDDLNLGYNYPRASQVPHHFRFYVARRRRLRGCCH